LIFFYRPQSATINIAFHSLVLFLSFSLSLYLLPSLSYCLHSNACSGILSLLFDKVINVSSFNGERIFAQSTRNSNLTTSSQLRLSSASVLSLNDITLNVSMGITHLNALKHLNTMTSTDTAFLCSSGSLLTDMYGNLMTELSCSAALKAMVFVRDTIPPRILNFSMSMIGANASVRVAFDEPISILSLVPTSLTLADKNGTRNLQLFSSEQVLQTTDGMEATITLSQNETELLKLNSICLHASSCQGVFGAAFATDVSGNPLMSVNLSASSVGADQVSPKLLFITLDMNTGLPRQ
jgi:hypothetical protein